MFIEKLLTSKMLEIFCRGSTKQWNFAFGYLSAITTRFELDRIQLDGVVRLSSDPSDQALAILNEIDLLTALLCIGQVYEKKIGATK